MREGKLKKRTILLVDDDETLRSVTAEALARDYRVLEAASCEEAVELMQADDVSLALIDYLLPACDGLALLKQLRTINADLPAIIITAYSTENLVIKALRAGATDYIRKPVRFSFLREKIVEILQQRPHAGDTPPPVSRDDVIIEGIAAYIENNYAEPLSQTRLAEMAGMSRFRFCKVFKTIMGESYTSFLNSVRIRNAADLLRNTDLPITEVSFSVGYGCITYFERVFKDCYGMSPTEYRRKDDTTPLLMK